MPEPNDLPTAPAGPPGEDQRAHVRYLCPQGVSLRLAIRPTYAGCRALLPDPSAGGLGLFPGRPLDTRAVLAVDLRGPEGTICTRLARVVHSRPHPTPDGAPWVSRPRRLLSSLRKWFGLPPSPGSGPCWLIGCRFDRPL